MKKSNVILLAIVLTTVWGCKNAGGKFPEVKSLSEYEKTEFLPTLENSISADKNAVYCVTLLYAWDEIRKKVELPLQMGKELTDLNLLNNSKSYLDVLKPNEYSAYGEINGLEITARAEFNKSLPFELKLQSFENKLTFNGTKVASFGGYGYESEVYKIVKIIYYKDDNNFIITLLPKNREHEIILYKTEQDFKTMLEMYADIEEKIILGKTERQHEKLRWKYYLADDDKVIIPKFQFNIATNFSTLEGNRFESADKEYQITRAWQRTAFTLDESGAEIESEAEVAVAEEVEEEYDKPKPKNLVFDKPFLLLLKRTDAENPYFGLWTTNTELMIEE